MLFYAYNPFGGKFKADNDMAAGVISQFVEVASTKHPSQGEDFFNAIQEVILPALPMHPGIKDKLTIFEKTRTFIERYGVNVPATELSGPLVARRIIDRIWNEDGFNRERENALFLLDSIRNKASNGITATSSVSSRNFVQESGPFQSSTSTKTSQTSNDVAKC